VSPSGQKLMQAARHEIHYHGRRHRALARHVLDRLIDVNTVQYSADVNTVQYSTVPYGTVQYSTIQGQSPNPVRSHLASKRAET
jgi:hypothetical protein